MRALRLALLAALLSLGSAWLAALLIQRMAGLNAGRDTSAPASLEIVATPELIAQGRDFFGQSCSHCHGDDATGDEGPNLHHLSISNARIAATIKKGVKGEMPTFAKKYDDHEIAALISYLRTLR
jgi:mono/diheme cytochrome c family protein